MTYRELKEVLDRLPDERLEDTVTVKDTNKMESYPVVDYVLANENQDVLDPGHLYLRF